jgi:hypothetical protein
MQMPCQYEQIRMRVEKSLHHAMNFDNSPRAGDCLTATDLSLSGDNHYAGTSLPLRKLLVNNMLRKEGRKCHALGANEHNCRNARTARIKNGPVPNSCHGDKKPENAAWLAAVA